jgi:hypothetical protein
MGFFLLDSFSNEDVCFQISVITCPTFNTLVALDHISSDCAILSRQEIANDVHDQPLSGTAMVKHLPPSIKHLLTLKNPQSLPSPPAKKLREIFLRTSRDAKQKKAETGWLVLTVQAWANNMHCQLPTYLPCFRPAPCSLSTAPHLWVISIAS